MNTLTGGGRTNVWDSQNRLASCTVNTVTSTFAYAADGLRHRMASGGVTTHYAYDSTMFVREFNDDGNGGVGTVKATYLVGARGPEYRRDASDNVRWYIYDGLGSVMGEVAPDGTLTRHGWRISLRGIVNTATRDDCDDDIGRLTRKTRRRAFRL